MMTALPMLQVTVMVCEHNLLLFSVSIWKFSTIKTSRGGRIEIDMTVFYLVALMMLLFVRWQ